MRLNCPNCGAQYEVPDEVIPEAGRDVQCSNCGHTWFQAHPNNPDALPPDEFEFADQNQDWEEEPDEDWDEPERHAPESESGAERRALDQGVANVLREEAEREQRARAEEVPETLETQPDLGLTPSSVAAEQSRQARERMARLRGLNPEEGDPQPEPDIDLGSRRNLLPDIEDVDEQIDTDSDRSLENFAARDGSRTAKPKKRRNRFWLGVRLAIYAAAIGTALYYFAPQISEAVPSLADTLTSYVDWVDQGRAALLSKVAPLLQR